MQRFCKAYLNQVSIFNRGKTFFPSLIRRVATNLVSENKDYIRPRRAILYVPGHDRRKIAKLSNLNVDCAVLDCEDGVALNMKAEARRQICEVVRDFDFGKKECAVRINSIDSGLAEEDILTILKCDKLPETLMVPKVENPSHLIWLNDMLKSHLQVKKPEKPLQLVFFVESAISLLNLRSLCAKAVELSQEGLFSFEGLVFGSDDFCADIGANRSADGHELITARQIFILYAKAFKVQAIDMVHINYKDLEGLRINSEKGAAMGFTGKQVIHPSQVPVVQKAFSPSAEKIEWATELIKVFKQHQNEGKGAFTFRGNMIDKPLLRQAEYIVKIAENLD